VARVLLLLPTATYRAADFVAAATRLGAEVVVGSEEAQAMAATMGDRSVVVPLGDPIEAANAIEALARRTPLDAVVAVDEQGVLAAAAAAERLGLRGNSPAAVTATRDKSAMRRALATAGVAQPRFALATDPDDLPDVGFPCVVKPVGLSASRGVIRADDPGAARAAVRRIRAMVDGPLLVEQYVPGVEVALEGLVEGGRLSVLALFDKPDPLEGPFFEETIYVTPSRLPPDTQARIAALVSDATAALRLSEGPVHA